MTYLVLVRRTRGAAKEKRAMNKAIREQAKNLKVTREAAGYYYAESHGYSWEIHFNEELREWACSVYDAKSEHYEWDCYQDTLTEARVHVLEASEHMRNDPEQSWWSRYGLDPERQKQIETTTTNKEEEQMTETTNKKDILKVGTDKHGRYWVNYRGRDYQIERTDDPDCVEYQIKVFTTDFNIFEFLAFEHTPLAALKRIVDYTHNYFDKYPKEFATYNTSKLRETVSLPVAVVLERSTSYTVDKKLNLKTISEDPAHPSVENSMGRLAQKVERKVIRTW